MGGRAHRRVDGQTSGRGRTMDGRADRRMGAGGRADGRTGWRTGRLTDGGCPVVNTYTM